MGRKLMHWLVLLSVLSFGLTCLYLSRCWAGEASTLLVGERCKRDLKGETQYASMLHDERDQYEQQDAALVIQRDELKQQIQELSAQLDKMKKKPESMPTPAPAPILHQGVSPKS